MKRHTWILIASAAITSISVAAPAVAAEPGFYFTAALGQAEEDPKSIGTNIGIGFPPAAIVHVDPDRVDVDDSGLAWSVAAGYRLNTYIAVEVEYMDFGTSDISEHYVFGPSVVPPFPSEFTNTYSSRVTGPAMSLLGSLPIGEDFDVFLRAGVLFADRELGFPPLAGSIELDDKFASTVWLGGAGVDWSFTSRWAIRAEYQRTGKLEKTSFLAGETELERMSLSLLFRL